MNRYIQFEFRIINNSEAVEKIEYESCVHFVLVPIYLFSFASAKILEQWFQHCLAVIYSYRDSQNENR